MIGRAVAVLAILGCGHSHDGSGGANASAALQIVVAAEAKPSSTPRAPPTAYCGGATAQVPGCSVSDSDRARLVVDTRASLEGAVRAFFSECRSRRDRVADVLVTAPSAPDHIVQFVAARITGSSDAGGMPYLRGRLDEALMSALADSLDARVAQPAAVAIEHLDTISDDDLLRVQAAASVPPDQIGNWIDMSLDYLGGAGDR